MNVEFFILEVCPCLEVPPDPGEPFSPPVPSLVLGLVCLSSLESLQNKQKLFPLGKHTLAPTVLKGGSIMFSVVGFLEIKINCAT